MQGQRKGFSGAARLTPLLLRHGAGSERAVGTPHCSSREWSSRDARSSGLASPREAITHT